MQESYYYQIFLDQKHSLVLPTVQQLLEHSFHSEGIKLAEVRSDSSSCFCRLNHQRHSRTRLPQRRLWVLQLLKSTNFLT